MTDPLVEFLLARNAEDKAVAQSATPGHWKLWGMSVMADQDGTSNVATAVPVAQTAMVVDGRPRTFDAHHIARWDPARVLAECEAKRRMIEDLVGESAEHWGPRENPEREWEWCPKVRTREFCAHTDLEWGPDAPCECHVEWPDYKRIPLLRYFTLPYADHPDCREEWKP
jgi:hypothetical protein